MDDLDLPPLSQSAQDEAEAASRPSLLLFRKRTRSDYDDEPTTSSDPALFSSDEQAPDAEQYVSEKRKKRVYTGSWWDRHPAKEGSRKSGRNREFTRNFDSGIFMGSESEEPLSSDSFTLEDELLRDQEKSNGKDQQHFPLRLPDMEHHENESRTKLAPKPPVPMPPEHVEVCEIVRQSLDQGKEDVDLSSMSLSSLPSEITSLQTLSKQEEIVPGMLDTGTDLEPRLRLYLANNLFTKVPSPILDLRNLRVLSLRNNNLTSIPPSIIELVNLESLNVAGNQLTDLPFEVFELAWKFNLNEITPNPNPWKQPPVEDPNAFFPWSGRGSLFVRPRDSSREQIRWAFVARDPPVSTTVHSDQTNSVPMLSELILRQLSRLDQRNETDFRQFMPRETSDNVLNHLDMLNRHPGSKCTTCKRPIVLAGNEWTEWWELCLLAATVGPPTNGPKFFVHQPGSCLPFRRAQCFSGCKGKENFFTPDGDENRHLFV